MSYLHNNARNMPKHDVAHCWAHNRETPGSTPNGSFSFSAGTLYSYNIVIAIKRGGVTFHTSTNYSPTTQRHQSAAWAASSHLERIDFPDGCHVANTHHDKLPCDGGPETYLHNLGRWFEQEYKKLARCKTRFVSQYEYLASRRETHLHWLERCIELYPEEFAPWGHLIAETRDKLIPSIDLQKRYDADCDPEVQALSAQEHAERKARSVERWLKKWREGLSNEAPSGYEFTYLRHLGPNETTRFDVRTSKGITIMEEDVLKALAAFKHGRLLGQKLAGFTITQVDTTKQVVIAGCHTVPFSEIEYIEKCYKEWKGKN